MSLCFVSVNVCVCVVVFSLWDYARYDIRLFQLVVFWRGMGGGFWLGLLGVLGELGFFLCWARFFFCYGSASLARCGCRLFFFSSSLFPPSVKPG